MPYKSTRRSRKRINRNVGTPKRVCAASPSRALSAIPPATDPTAAAAIDATAEPAAMFRNGPVGKVREVFDRVSKLPRRQQEHIVNWVSAYVSQYEQTRQG